jgi:hypothetical protein
MTPKDKKDIDLSTSSGVTVTYKASGATFIRLNQHHLILAMEDNTVMNYLQRQQDLRRL